MSRKQWGLLALVIAVVGVASLMVAVATAKESHEKGYLGVVLGEVTSDVAGDYGVQAGGGVLVEGVVPGSPADEAGLRANDVIVRVNTMTPTGPEEFRQQVGKLKPGENVDLTYLRGGKEKTIQVKLAKREVDEEWEWGPGRSERRFRFEGPPWEWRRESTDEPGEKMAYAGIHTQELSGGLAQYFKVEKGVLVSEVVKDSPAERAGLKAGDVILRIGDKDVENERDVRREIHARKPGEAVNFVINREGQQQTIAVTLGEQIGHRFPFAEEDFYVDGKALRMMIPDAKEFERLEKELDNLRIEIEAIPDINLDSIQMNFDMPRIRVHMDKHEVIDHRDTDQPRNSRRLRDRLADAFQRLSRQVNELVDHVQV